MRDLFFYVLGGFSGMFIMCALSLCKKKTSDVRKKVKSTQ